MGYRLVQAVLVVTLGRLGDMYGRVRIYNAGFAVFTAASILLSFDPFHGRPRRAVADRLAGAPGHRRVHAHRQLGRDPHRRLPCRPARLRAGHQPDRRPSPGQFIGLVAGGVLAAMDWRAVFWVNVPVGVFGTVWAYRKLRDTGERHPGRIDWWGNVTFAARPARDPDRASPTASSPTADHTMGWTNPLVLAGLLAGGRAAAGRVRPDRDAGRRPDVPARPVPHPRLRGGQRRRPRSRPSPAAACSSCSSSGCRASGCRCTATTTPTPRCGPASSCCR